MSDQSNDPTYLDLISLLQPIYLIRCGSCPVTATAFFSDGAGPGAQTLFREGWRATQGQACCPTCANKKKEPAIGDSFAPML
jgi:hypothetical protein